MKCLARFASVGEGPAVLCGPWAFGVVIGLIGFVAGCRGELGVEDRAPSLSVRPELEGRLLVIRVGFTAGGGGLVPLASGVDSVGPLPVALRLDGDQLSFSRVGEGPGIRVLTFERAGERSAYGVYGLSGAKREISVACPLMGDPIAWENRATPEALAYLLRHAGLDSVSAAALVSSRGPDWFGEGLRVFFVISGSLPEHLASPAETERARAILIRADLLVR